jgi:GH15 family glucan-1,4-alpha-glucosidase
MKDVLWCRTAIGGMARYQNDRYQAAVMPNADVQGNPWIISTLWYARFLIETAVHKDDLMKAAEMLHWVAGRALPSDILPEQVNPLTGEHVSVSPLVWSHAELVITMQKFTKRFLEMEKCPHCSQPLYFKV